MRNCPINRYGSLRRGRRHLELRPRRSHINPAVTFALLLCRKLSLVRAALYVVAQCLGAICGSAVVRGVTGRSYEALGGGANVVADGFTVRGALGAEVVLSATDPKRTARDSFIPVLVPLPIGFAVFAGAPGHHTHHRHRDQPGQEPRRRCHLQPAQSMETPLDLLGRAAHQSDMGGDVPPVRDARQGRQGAAELVQEHGTSAATARTELRYQRASELASTNKHISKLL